jgi:hypothetical protein
MGRANIRSKVPNSPLSHSVSISVCHGKSRTNGHGARGEVELVWQSPGSWLRLKTKRSMPGCSFIARCSNGNWGQSIPCVRNAGPPRAGLPLKSRCVSSRTRSQFPHSWAASRGSIQRAQTLDVRETMEVEEGMVIATDLQVISGAQTIRSLQKASRRKALVDQ